VLVRVFRVSQKCPNYSGYLTVCELDNGQLIDDESMTGWWLGTFFSMTVHSVGNGKIIPTDELTPSFFRGVSSNHQADYYYHYYH